MKACREAEEDQIIITHGTDTMELTAQKNWDPKNWEKTIILTGAMVPYSMAESDAVFNLGSA